MKNGSTEQKKQYEALKNEAGDRAAKGFRTQSVGQWFANAADMRNIAKCAGAAYGGGDGSVPNSADYARKLDLFQPAKDANPWIGNNISNSGTAGDHYISPNTETAVE